MAERSPPSPAGTAPSPLALPDWLSETPGENSRTAHVGAEARGVVLAGATGFLGAHLLAELLRDGEVPVFCLVRAPDDAAANDRLWQRFAWYFPELASSTDRARVRALAADVTRDDLGLTASTYRELADSTCRVFNAAADVRHVGHLRDFARINTEAVQRLLDFSNTGCPKHLHHVSTIAVKGRPRHAGGGELEPPPFSELDLDVGQTFVDHPYAESKFRGELLVRDACRQGARASVYRVGNIGPHSLTGRFQQNIKDSAFAAHVWACVRLGFAPYRPRTSLRLMPVDLMARAVCWLARSHEETGRTYHVEHTEEMNHYDVLRVLQAFGYPIRLASERDFMDHVARVADDASLGTLLQTAAAEAGSATSVDCRATERALRELQFECPRVSAGWLARFLEHAIDVGFLDPPPFRLRVALPELLL
jgi:thioester reductase-like protein